MTQTPLPNGGENVYKVRLPLAVIVEAIKLVSKVSGNEGRC